MNGFVFKNPKRIRCYLGLIGLILVASSIACAADIWVLAEWVADGDTIVLRDGRHVRYLGIDTPEIDHENNRAATMGYEARSENRKLVEGRQLRLIYDQKKKDHYGRILAYVYRRDGLFVNAELLKQGYAYFLYRVPNTSKAKILLAAQREAMKGSRGIWQLVKKTEKSANAYVGNQRSKRFHAHDCPMAKKMSAKNRVRLNSLWRAFWSGYAPARECIAFPEDE